MIFYIDNSLEKEFSIRDITDEETIFFTGLAIAHQRGFCVLCGELHSLEFLYKKLGNPVNGIYKSICSNYSEQKSIFQMVKLVFVLTYCDKCPDTLPEAVLSITHMAIRIKDALDNQLDNKCCLLAENLNDCVFYQIIGHYYCIQNDIRGMQICFSNTLGGGDTISNVYAECIEKNKTPVLCIVDSDMKYGKTSEYSHIKKGDTLRKAIATDKQMEKYVAIPHFLYSPEIHEIENLIPICVLKAMDKSDAIEILEQLNNIRAGEPLLYYDLKEGIGIKHDNKPYNEYWREIYDEAKKAGIISNELDLVIEENELLFSPVHVKNILKKAIGEMKASPSIVCPEGRVRDCWMELGAILLMWGCAKEPLRV